MEESRRRSACRSWLGPGHALICLMGDSMPPRKLRATQILSLMLLRGLGLWYSWAIKVFWSRLRRDSAGAELSRSLRTVLFCKCQKRPVAGCSSGKGSKAATKPAEACTERRSWKHLSPASLTNPRTEHWSYRSTWLPQPTPILVPSVDLGSTWSRFC